MADADGKHYVPIGYHVRVVSDTELHPDDQHSNIDVFTPPFDRGFHPYVEQYLSDAKFPSE